MDTQELKRLPLFSSLGDDDLAKVATWATETSISEGKALVHEGDYAYGLTIIAAGTAEVRHDDQVLTTLGEGDVFGEMAALDNEKRSADVVATSSMRLITISNWDLRRMPKSLVDELKRLGDERRASNAG